MAQGGRTRGGAFHEEMNRYRESQAWTTVCSGICPNVTAASLQLTCSIVTYAKELVSVYICYSTGEWF